MQVIDNFLDTQSFWNIHSTMSSKNFPWNKIQNLSGINPEDGIYFVHMFLNQLEQSSYINLIQPLLVKLNPFAVRRIKGNFYLPSKKVITHTFHKDYDLSHRGCIYYVNNNDGYTILKGNKKIKSVANRALLFDPSEEHCSTSSTNPEGRINININYF